MMHTSMLERDELRIFEELISRFDSLTEAQMSAVGVTPEWSAKDLLAHLAYWERAAAEQVREFEAGRWPAKERYSSQNRAHQPGGRFRESGHATTSSSRETDPSEERNRGGDGTSARGTGGKVNARTHRLLSSACGIGGIIWNNFKLGLHSLAKRCERKGIFSGQDLVQRNGNIRKYRE
jgi:hypothetical protein